MTDLPINSLSDLRTKYLLTRSGAMINPKSKVGKVFEKRDIVKVVRHLPTPAELQNPLRFVAVAPESSGIFPLRGPLAIEPPVASQLRYDERILQSPVSEDRMEEDGRAQKRQKIGNLSWQNPSNFDNVDPQQAIRTGSCTDNCIKLMSHRSRGRFKGIRGPALFPCKWPFWTNVAQIICGYHHSGFTTTTRQDNAKIKRSQHGH